MFGLLCRKHVQSDEVGVRHKRRLRNLHAIDLGSHLLFYHTLATDSADV